jgi:hypothetical protein
MSSHHVSCRSVRLDAENASQHWQARSSALLQLRAQGAAEANNASAPVTGFGEACPLPGISPESLLESESWLVSQRPAWSQALAAETAGAALELVAPNLTSAPPSARYAAELALLGSGSNDRCGASCAS